MEPHPLHELLDKLHGELQEAHSARSLSEEDRALLHEVQADISRLLAPPSAGTPAAVVADPAANAETRSRLQEAAARFAGSHPRLSGALGDMFNAFSNAGL